MPRSNFHERCDQIREQLRSEMLELVRKYVTSYEELKEISETDDEFGYELLEYQDIERYLGEVGCPICERSDGTLFLGNCESPGTGAGCNIDYRACLRLGGKNVGTFHTHPLGGVTPSYQDLVCTRREKEEISCIGGFDGRKDMILCFTPNERAKEYGFFVDMLKNTYYPSDAQFKPDGEIKFYREPPPPTPTDLMSDLQPDDVEHLVTSWEERGWKDLSDENKRESVRKEIKKRVDEFYAELERGDIPQEYWDSYESPEGYMDSLNYYSPETLYNLEQERKKHLTRDAHLCEL